MGFVIVIELDLRRFIHHQGDVCSTRAALKTSSRVMLPSWSGLTRMGTKSQVPTGKFISNMIELSFLTQRQRSSSRWRKHKVGSHYPRNRKKRPERVRDVSFYSPGASFAMILAMVLSSIHHCSRGRCNLRSAMRSKSRMSWKMNFPFCKPMKQADASLLLHCSMS